MKRTPSELGIDGVRAELGKMFDAGDKEGLLDNQIAVVKFLAELIRIFRRYRVPLNQRLTRVRVALRNQRVDCRDHGVDGYRID